MHTADRHWSHAHTPTLYAPLRICLVATRQLMFSQEDPKVLADAMAGAVWEM